MLTSVVEQFQHKMQNQMEELVEKEFHIEAQHIGGIDKVVEELETLEEKENTHMVDNTLEPCGKKLMDKMVQVDC
ncbi:MAG: hypothetical protein HFJ54_08280 [Clostridia bacterium]|nr:hypothetical protein [Clostridia bacterium]